MVRGDEAGHDDRARAVDHFGVAGGDVGRDMGDHLAVDQDVGLLEVAHFRVEAEHDAPPQQDAALAAVADEVLKVRWGGRSQAGQRLLTRSRRSHGWSLAAGRDKRGARQSRRARLQEIAPRSRAHLDLPGIQVEFRVFNVPTAR